MPNEIKVKVDAKETGLAKIESDARATGKAVGDSLEKGAKQGTQATEDAAKKITSAFDGAHKKISRDLDAMKTEAWESGKNMDREYMRSLQSMEDELRRVRTEAGKTGADLDSELGSALRNVKRDMEKLGDQARKTGKEIKQELHKGIEEGGGGGSFGDAFSGQLSGGFDVSGMIEGLGGGAGGAWASAGAVAGGLFADQAFKAMESSLSQRSVGGLISAQNGGTIAEGVRAGKVAGEAYYDGFAESIEGAGESLGAVIGRGLSDLDAPAAELQKLTDMSSTAVQVVGEDASQIARAAKQLLVNGLAENAEQAIDLIVSASQRGANVSDDLLDTIVEYGTKFRDVGLSGQEAMGLISQALQGGARDADVAADAIKELSIRVGDGTAARGLQAIGLNANEMRQQFAQGGESAHEAMRKILNGLNQIEDPAKRDQAALDLFGTKAEDLGDAVYSMDLDTAASQMDNFAGQTERTAKVIAATQSPTEKLKRSWDEFVNDTMNDTVFQAEEVQSSFHKTTNATDAAADSAKKAATASHDYADALQEIISAGEKMAGGVLTLSDAQIGYQESLAAANTALSENHRNMDITTEGGRENQGALNDLAKSTWDVVAAMEQQQATTQDVQSFIQSSRDSFIQLATDMGLDAGAAALLADKLGLVPGNYQANVEVTGYELAYARVEAIEDKLRQLPASKTVNLRINTSGSGMGGHFFAAHGGPASAAELGAIYRSGMPHAASGGASGMADIVTQEQGAEITRMPNGSIVIPHGQSEAVMAGMGGGGSVVAQFVLGGPTDELGRAFVRYLQSYVKNEHGGNVASALGQRSGA